MAQFDLYAPTIMQWEVGVTSSGLDPEILYEQFAAPVGYAKIAGDKGGDTMVGVTLDTYRSRFGKERTVEDLKKMSWCEWRSIMKGMFWDKMQADQIENQSQAEQMVDWLINAGTGKVKNIQRVLGVVADGIVGPKTLAAINGADQKALFNKVQSARKAWYESLIAANPSYEKFRRGWLRRVESFTFSENE